MCEELSVLSGCFSKCGLFMQVKVSNKLIRIKEVEDTFIASMLFCVNSFGPHCPLVSEEGRALSILDQHLRIKQIL